MAPKCIQKLIFGKDREKGAKSVRPSLFFGNLFGGRVKRGAKGNQSEPMNLQKHHLRNMVEKVWEKEDSGDYSPEPFLIKSRYKYH